MGNEDDYRTPGQLITALLAEEEQIALPMDLTMDIEIRKAADDDDEEKKAAD